jgi:hypothetical protein
MVIMAQSTNQSAHKLPLPDVVQQRKFQQKFKKPIHVTTIALEIHVNLIELQIDIHVPKNKMKDILHRLGGVVYKQLRMTS